MYYMRSKIYRVCVWEGTRYKRSKCEQEEKRETKDIGEVIRVRYDVAQRGAVDTGRRNV